MAKSRLKIQSILILSTLFCLPFYFIKIKYGWASLNLIEILIIALFLLWIFDKEKKLSILNFSVRGEARRGRKFLIPAVLILAGVVISATINSDYYVGLGIIKGWFALPMIFAIILYDNLMRNEDLLDKIFITLFASGTFVAIEGIYYWFSGFTTFDGRLRIFFDSPNQLAMFLAPALLIGVLKIRSWGTFRQESGEAKGLTMKNSWILLLAGASVILLTMNLYFTKSSGAWLAVMATLGAIFWLKYSKLLVKRYLIITVAVLLAFIGWISLGKLKNIQSLGNRSSLSSREMIWRSAGLMIEKKPLFGVGPGNFQNTFLEYQKYFPPYLEWSVPQPHNLLLAFWLESGLLGLAGFVWLLVLFFKDNKKARHWRGSLNVSRERNFEAGLICLAVILYFLVHGLVDTTYWRNDMAIVFWVIIAANSYIAENSRDKSGGNELKSKMENPKAIAKN